MPKRNSKYSRELADCVRLNSKLASQLTAEKKVAQLLSKQLSDITEEVRLNVLLSSQAFSHNLETPPLLTAVTLSVKRVVAEAPKELEFTAKYTTKYASDFRVWGERRRMSQEVLLSLVDKNLLFETVAAQFAKGFLDAMEKLNE